MLIPRGEESILAGTVNAMRLLELRVMYFLSPALSFQESRSLRRVNPAFSRRRTDCATAWNGVGEAFTKRRKPTAAAGGVVAMVIRRSSARRREARCEIDYASSPPRLDALRNASDRTDSLPDDAPAACQVVTLAARETTANRNYRRRTGWILRCSAITLPPWLRSDEGGSV